MSFRDKMRCGACRHARHKHYRDPRPGGCRDATGGESCSCAGFREPPAYVLLGNGDAIVAGTVRKHNAVLIDVDADGRLVGIEIIDPPGAPSIELPPYHDDSTYYDHDDTTREDGE